MQLIPHNDIINDIVSNNNGIVIIITNDKVILKKKKTLSTKKNKVNEKMKYILQYYLQKHINCKLRNFD